MKIVKKEKVKIDEVVKILKEGGLVILPTETLYGAMVDATNQKAVKKLTRYKRRPLGKPFSVAVSDKKMAQEYVELNQTAENLYNNFLPGPLTVVSKGKHQVARGVESETGTLGIRIPAYPLVLKVVKKLGKPITATSANASYQKRPYQISDILENLSKRQNSLIDIIIDAGKLPPNEPSTVIDTTYDEALTLRVGKIKGNVCKRSNKTQVLSTSEENTQNVAKELWQKYERYWGQRAIVFALEGEMGTGKTVFTKGLAQAMGIKQEVISPSYILEVEYKSRGKEKVKKLIHIDAWRMQESQELEVLGFDKLITDRAVLSIEWADKVAGVVRRYNEEAIIIWVKIDYGKKDNERLISFRTI